MPSFTICRGKNPGLRYFQIFAVTNGFVRTRHARPAKKARLAAPRYLPLICRGNPTILRDYKQKAIYETPDPIIAEQVESTLRRMSLRVLRLF